MGKTTCDLDESMDGEDLFEEQSCLEPTASGEGPAWAPYGNAACWQDAAAGPDGAAGAPGSPGSVDDAREIQQKIFEIQQDATLQHAQTQNAQFMKWEQYSRP